MLFTEPATLFVFLPLVLAISRFAPRTVCNYALVLLSLLFYGIGEPRHLWLLVVSSLLNYAGGVALDATQTPTFRRAIMIGGVGSNLALLALCKYSGFLADNLNAVFGLVSDIRLERPTCLLPLGISFYTFQGLSYLLDVYWRNVKAERNPAHLMLYICLFPQLVAGPIVRFTDVAADLHQRNVTLNDWSFGIRLFILGFARKMLIANPVGECADAIFALPGNQLSAALAWTGLLTYSIQIYFDFSGYSTMAIGIGRILGFRFPENFNDPYMATSVRDFWRRWHMSLSTWFRDYLYIPLGGNRRSAARNVFNLLTVFLLCGLWHGASWNFVLWGALHGLFLTLEREPRFARAVQLPLVNRIYTLSVVLIGWVLFRCETISHAGEFFRALLVGSSSAVPVSLFLSHTGLAALVAGLIWSTPAFNVIQSRLRIACSKSGWLQGIHDMVLVGGLAGLLLLTMSQAAADTFNPFIYFRF